MKSLNACETIVKHRGRAVLVCTMTSIKWVYQLDPNGLNACCVPLMGGASALGLGISIAQPDRPVAVLDGDGSLLMQLASLVTAVEAAPPNFVHFVFNNGVWFENMANLPVPGAKQIDYAGLARSAGYQQASRYTTAAELDAALPELLSGGGPRFVELVIEPEKVALWSGENLQVDLPDFHFARMGNDARRLRKELANQPA